jgi:hypothetical protein
MFRRSCLSALLGLVVCASAGDPAPLALTGEQRKDAEFLENLSIPSPGELFTAYGKIGKPDWTALFRKPPPHSIISRPLIALNLGTLIADGFLAAEAQDKQEVKNVSREIKALAKGLGLEQEFIVRNNSIAAFADGRQWEVLDEEFEAVQSEFAAAMSVRRDDELAVLMALGCWLRSMETVSAHLAANYTTQGAGILRQPGVGGFFAARLDMLSAKITSIPVIAEIHRGLPALDTALSQPAETPLSGEAAAAMHTLTAGMMRALSAPQK